MKNAIHAIVMTCPRCGDQYIRPQVGEIIHDGGYTKIEQYEPLPDNWKLLKEYNEIFCPVCSREYERRLSDFLNYPKEAVMKK